MGGVLLFCFSFFVRAGFNTFSFLHYTVIHIFIFGKSNPDRTCYLENEDGESTLWLVAIDTRRTAVARQVQGQGL